MSALLATTIAVGVPVSASGAEPQIQGDASPGAWELDGRASAAGGYTPSSTPNDAASASTSTAAYVDYAWTYACGTTYPGPVIVPECGLNSSCGDPDSVAWRLWSQRPDGTWEGSRGFECFGEDDDPNAGEAAPAAITPGMALNEIRRIGLPTPSVRTQPPGRTLVNLETNLLTSQESFTAEVTLLGRQVSLSAAPVGYVFDHGDGTSTTTDEPGREMPGGTLVHTYGRAGSVAPSVSITWAASFSVDGGPVTEIEETITVDGPAATLAVLESVPRLAGQD